MDITDDIANSPFAWMLGVPDLNPIFDQYVREGRTADWLKAQIEKTNWWKTNNASSRQWQDLSATDPAEAQTRYEGMYSKVQLVAARVGVNDPGKVAEISRQAVSLGWTDEQIRAALVVNATPSGDMRSYMQSVHDAAGEYLFAVSDDTAFTLGKAMFLGSLTPEGMKSQMREIAKANFPGLASQLDQGFTMRQITDPMRQAVANTLEVAPAAIDLIKNPKYAKMLTVTDEKTKTQRPMTITEATQYARSMPEWGKTFGARNEADNATKGLLQTFGQGGF